MKKLFLNIIIIILFGIIFFVSSNLVFANISSIDTSFDIGLPVGFDNSIKTIASQQNAKILIGGNFTLYNGISTRYIVRLNSDGTKDGSFNIGSGFNSYVNSIVVQSDGKILVGGDFTNYNGENKNRIIRLNTDGSVDNSFSIGSGLNANVNSIVVQSDSKILVGGDFTNYNGENKNRIIRLNTDGSVDNSFSIGSGLNANVNSIVLQSDSKILVGGDFTNYNGESKNRIIRLNTDGSVDNSFSIGSGLNTNVNSIVVQSDGKILVGGDFTNYNGESKNRIIRLNTDGSVDNSFNIGSGLNANVNSIVLQSDGKILVGGDFTNYNGESKNRIIRLNADGSIDNSFIIGVGFNSYINSVHITNNSKILIGGNFMTYSRIAVNRIVRLNNDGSRDTSFNIGNGFNNMINATAIQSDGKILVGGQFTSYAGTVINRITRLNADGSVDNDFSSGSLANDNINTIAIQNDNKIIIGGNFRSYNLESLNRIVRLNENGTRDMFFNIGNGFNNNVNSIVIDSDGKILVAGSFTNYNSVDKNRIVRLNTDGSIDDSFNIGSGFNATIDALKIQSDGKILVGGSFTNYNGVDKNRIVRLNTDGSIDSSFNIGNGFNANVNVITVQTDNKILLGGQFTNYSGTNINRIIRLNTDGSRDISFNVGNGCNNVVRNIAILSNGKIIIGGSFTTYNSLGSNYIAGLNSDGSIDGSFNIGVGFNNYVKTINVSSDERILVGGNFTSYRNGSAGYLVSLYGNSNVVVIPNSTDINIIKDEFTNKGYLQSNGDLVGSTAISLSDVDGKLPVDLSIKNQDIKITMPADLQFKQGDSSNNYDGIISVPTTKNIDSVNDEVVLSSFKVGSSVESIGLTGGVATLLSPVSGQNIGDQVDIYYSEDNGVTRYYQGNATVIEYNNQPYVSFTTDHFTDFAITLPPEQGGGEFNGSFTINNDAASTTSQNVTLNISTTPAASQMKFSNDGTNRSTREAYATSKSWTLSAGYGNKTVYAQFDVQGDQISDAQTSDIINYTDGSGGSCALGEGVACLNLEISAVDGYCQYGKNLDLGQRDQSYSAFVMSGDFLNLSGSDSRYCDDRAGKSAWTLDISASNLVTSGDNVFTIPNTAIEMFVATPQKYLGSTSFTFANGDFANQWANLATTKTVFEKTSDAGSVGKLGTDSVDLRVNIPANQAIGAYQSTITIQVPVMNI